MTRLPPVALALALLASSRPVAAQPDDPFLDPEARVLHAAARARWLEADRSLLRYQAVVSQRMRIGLRLPLRDRTLLHREAAARVIWERGSGDERGGVTAVQLLARNAPPDEEVRESADGSRSCTPATCASAGMDGVFLRGFEPRGDPLLLRLDRWRDDEDGDGEGFVHPLSEGAERHYRFRSGSSVTVSLPHGRALRVVELTLLPRRDDPFLLSGTLWIEPATGALVRAVYRMARPLDVVEDTEEDEEEEDVPGLLRPLVVDVSLVAVEYALWDLRIWMPRSMRVEGTVRAGLLSAPVVGEIGYDVEEVVLAGDGAAPLGADASVERLSALAAAAGGGWRVASAVGRGGAQVRWLVPSDSGALAGSPLLPEPVWSEHGAFARSAELEEMAETLADVAGPIEVATVANLAWGMQHPGLVRYNRVEGISVGARGAARFGVAGRPVSAALTARLGSADLEPRASLVLTHETLARALRLSAYRELELVEPSTRALGIGASLNAFLFGRDDGDYVQATGASLGLTPPTAKRAWYRARAYAERQVPVARETDASLLNWIGWDGGFRPSTPASRADQAGIDLALSPWWGEDPLRPGAGLEVGLQAERGTFDFERARLGARAALPLPLGARLALAAGGGTTWGAAPPQRLWMLGGPSSLRGLAPGALLGPTFLSGRAELVVPLSGVAAARAVGLAVFTDGGWAGDRARIRWDDAAASAGVGLSILDGVLRLDAAWGFHGREGRRLDLYLDGLL